MRRDEADVSQGPCVLARDEVQERRLEERAVLAAQAAVAWTAEKSGCQRDARPALGHTYSCVCSSRMVTWGTHRSASTCRTSEPISGGMIGGKDLRDGGDEGTVRDEVLSPGEHGASLEKHGLRCQMSV